MISTRSESGQTRDAARGQEQFNDTLGCSVSQDDIAVSASDDIFIHLNMF